MVGHKVGDRRWCNEKAEIRGRAAEVSARKIKKEGPKNLFSWRLLLKRCVWGRREKDWKRKGDGERTCTYEREKDRGSRGKIEGRRTRTMK